MEKFLGAVLPSLHLSDDDEAERWEGGFPAGMEQAEVRCDAHTSVRTGFSLPVDELQPRLVIPRTHFSWFFLLPGFSDLRRGRRRGRGGSRTVTKKAGWASLLARPESRPRSAQLAPGGWRWVESGLGWPPAGVLLVGG